MKLKFEGKYENVYEHNDNLILINKYTHICILPYILENGILSKIGVINDYNFVRNKYIPTLYTSLKNSDNISDLDSANQLLYNMSNINIENGYKWMYLGDLFINNLSDSSLKLYCVDVTEKYNEFEKNKSKFYFINVEESILSDDMLLLSGYLRLFNLFYTQQIIKNNPPNN